MTPLADNLVLRRAAALLLLGALVAALAPPLTAPVRAWLAARESVAEERRIVERLARIEARRGAVLEAARASPAPFLVAADAGEALAALGARAVAAAPFEALRIEAVEPLAGAAGDERPGAPVGLVVRFEATPSGLYAFLRELETGAPAVRVGELAVEATGSGDGAPVVLRGTAELRAAFLLREEGQP